MNALPPMLPHETTAAYLARIEPPVGESDTVTATQEIPTQPAPPVQHGGWGDPRQYMGLVAPTPYPKRKGQS